MDNVLWSSVMMNPTVAAAKRITNAVTVDGAVLSLLLLLANMV